MLPVVVASLFGIALLDSVVYGAQSPPNSTACDTCSDLCSTIPPEGSTYPLCYQGSPNATRDEYNYDPENPSDSVPVCSTCSANGFPYFIQYDLYYPGVEIWSNENPLCTLLAATNIGVLVGEGTMQGWSCNGLTPTSDYCDGWTGVSCNASSPFPLNTSVTSLLLPELGLTGTLPSELVGLNYMTSLGLAHNSLNGHLIALTSELLVLDVSYNSLSGAIPDSIGSLYALQTLNLASNGLSQPLPAVLGHFPNVYSMNFSSNFDLVGTVPAEICGDFELTYLNVGNNPSLGCYSNCLTSVSELVVNDAENNCLDDLIAAEGTALCDLYQATNIPALVGSGVLGGWNCTATGEPVGDFCSWFGVYCGISVPDDGRVQIDDILELNTTVYELNLPFLGILGTLPSTLGQLSYLNILNLEGNQLHGSLSPEFNSFRKMTNAILNTNAFSGSLPDYPNWVSIQQLLLSENKFTGTIPTAMGNMIAVYLLELEVNNFEGEVPIELCNASSLNTLDFSENPLLTCYANCLGSVPNLVNQQNITTCNNVSTEDVSHNNIPYLIIGGTIFLVGFVIGLIYVFAREQVVFLFSEAKAVAIRFTEHARGLAADLDFSDIRASTLRPSIAANLYPYAKEDNSEENSTLNPMKMESNVRSIGESRKSLEFDTTSDV